jgi:Skp family chaperone for outer membrane proteins
MASPGRIPSSPPKGVSLEDEVNYYKSQYQQVELELQEFQASSKELEAELEKDIEESENRERRLREKAEQLNFEVDEWKVRKHNCVTLCSVTDLLQDQI